MAMQSIAQGMSAAKIKALIFALFLALSILLPALIHLQWVTGPTVNAMLFIATVILGPAQAMLLGLMPGTVALSTGLLPLPLAPMVPFIMISNAILVIAFEYSYRKNALMAIALAAVCKFLFLQVAVNFILKSVVAGNLTSALATMVSWPQLITALAGGFVAYTFLKSIKKL
ncbi:iron hydrogenase [Candidatus Peregrinibacteria bacterium]|nr:iron hydrogenase [Candidatus Peregrinibacteria bacterium]